MNKYMHVCMYVCLVVFLHGCHSMGSSILSICVSIYLYVSICNCTPACMWTPMYIHALIIVVEVWIWAMEMSWRRHGRPPMIALVALQGSKGH